MTYKTILVHLDQVSRAQERIRIAADLAVAGDAHLIGAAMIGISTLTFDRSHIEEKDPALASHLAFLRERARGFSADFESIAQQRGVLSYEGRVVDGEAGYGICLQARYCDLVVLGQANLNDPSPLVGSDFPESVLINGGRPVLIVPNDRQFAGMGKKVLISWNASREATRAVTDAIQILKAADIVQVAVFNVDPRSDSHGERAGDDVALFLARHGINVDVLPAQRSRNIGNDLLSEINTLSSDLLVMGGYGHTRFREFLVGGVTRTILDQAGIPVLMSH